MIVKQPYKEHGICNERCKKCIYRASWSGNTIVFCQYISLKGTMRPCPAGKHCTEFVQGRPLMEKKSVAVVQRSIRKCEMCGQNYYANQKQKYCDECRKKRNAALCRERNARIREQNREKAYAKVKICAWCGKEFHNAHGKAMYCEECKIFRSHKRRPR